MKKYKGIVLAGGAGTRLYPMTSLYSKQLINIYDKPMIYYPLSLLMMVDIRDILIISDSKTLPLYQTLFGDGSKLGINIQYAVQHEPKGIAEAFIIGEEFIGGDNVSLILGDNLFYGDSDFFRTPLQNHAIATIFAYYVNDPKNYGIVEITPANQLLSIEEKPEHPKSNYAIPGLYIYDNSVVDVAKNLQASPRGELEITDVNKYYMDNATLDVQKIGRGIAWLDTGMPDSLLEASNFIAAIEHRQGLKMGCLEEIAYQRNFIDIKQFQKLINNMPNSQYRQYLEGILYD